MPCAFSRYGSIKLRWYADGETYEWLLSGNSENDFLAFGKYVQNDINEASAYLILQFILHSFMFSIHHFCTLQLFSYYCILFRAIRHTHIPFSTRKHIHLTKIFCKCLHMKYNLLLLALQMYLKNKPTHTCMQPYKWMPLSKTVTNKRLIYKHVTELIKYVTHSVLLNKN